MANWTREQFAKNAEVMITLNYIKMKYPFIKDFLLVNQFEFSIVIYLVVDPTEIAHDCNLEIADFNKQRLRMGREISSRRMNDFFTKKSLARELADSDDPDCEFDNDLLEDINHELRTLHSTKLRGALQSGYEAPSELIAITFHCMPDQIKYPEMI